jgi:hypothetical protein
MGLLMEYVKENRRISDPDFMDFDYQQLPVEDIFQYQQPAVEDHFEYQQPPVENQFEEQMALLGTHFKDSVLAGFAKSILMIDPNFVADSCQDDTISVVPNVSTQPTAKQETFDTAQMDFAAAPTVYFQETLNTTQMSFATVPTMYSQETGSGIGFEIDSTNAVDRLGNGHTFQKPAFSMAEPAAASPANLKTQKVNSTWMIIGDETPEKKEYIKLEPKLYSPSSLLSTGEPIEPWTSTNATPPSLEQKPLLSAQSKSLEGSDLAPLPTSRKRKAENSTGAHHSVAVANKRANLSQEAYDTEAASKDPDYLIPKVGKNAANATTSSSAFWTLKEVFLLTKAVNGFRVQQGLTGTQVIDIIQGGAAANDAARELWNVLVDSIKVYKRQRDAVMKRSRRLFNHFNSGSWTKEEDQMVSVLHRDLAETGKWKELSYFVKRSGDDIQTRWRDYLAPKDKLLGPWTAPEDNKLKKLVTSWLAKHPDIEKPEDGRLRIGWKEIADGMKTRDRNQCRDRYSRLNTEKDSSPQEGNVMLDKISEKRRQALRVAESIDALEKLAILIGVQEYFKVSGYSKQDDIVWHQIGKEPRWTEPSNEDLIVAVRFRKFSTAQKKAVFQTAMSELDDGEESDYEKLNKVIKALNAEIRKSDALRSK